MPAKPFGLDRIISESPGERQATLPFFIAVNEVANHSSPPPYVDLDVCSMSSLWGEGPGPPDIKPAVQPLHISFPGPFHAYQHLHCVLKVTRQRHAQPLTVFS